MCSKTNWDCHAVGGPRLNLSPGSCTAGYTVPLGPCVVATDGPPAPCMVPPRDHDIQVSYDSGPYWNEIQACACVLYHNCTCRNVVHIQTTPSRIGLSDMETMTTAATTEQKNTQRNAIVPKDINETDITTGNEITEMKLLEQAFIYITQQTYPLGCSKNEKRSIRISTTCTGPDLCFHCLEGGICADLEQWKRALANYEYCGSQRN